jgi:hypothetical protein
VSDVTRRGFVKNSAGAVAGASVIGAIVADQAVAADPDAAGSEQVVAHVRDPRRGEIDLMVGEREVTVRDRKLAARIARAAR